MILSLVNVKGGVGKTTTAVNLAAAFAGTGLRVLVVDLDPQGSASYSLGVSGEEQWASSVDLLLNETPVQQAIQTTGVEGVDLVAGTMDLAGSDLVLARKRDPHQRLAKALAPVRRRYDFVLVDCPPGLSILTVNGLTAAGAFVVPVAPHDLDILALDRFFEGLEKLQGTVRRMPRLLGILLTMVDHRTRVTEEIISAVRHGYGRDVFRTEIPINVRLAEAPGYGLNIFSYQGWSTGAQAYSRLGGEVIRRLRKSGAI
jgi:chromosome partitioning protein